MRAIAQSLPRYKTSRNQLKIFLTDQRMILTRTFKFMFAQEDLYKSIIYHRDEHETINYFNFYFILISYFCEFFRYVSLSLRQVRRSILLRSRFSDGALAHMVERAIRIFFASARSSATGGDFETVFWKLRDDYVCVYSIV
jgi:hypothetical protein